MQQVRLMLRRAGEETAIAGLEFSVLLIGGSSATAKTSTALEAGRRLGFTVLNADDLRLALQRVTVPSEQRALHQFLDRESVVWTTAERYARGLIEVAEVMSKGIEPIIEHHLHRHETGPIIIEGDGVEPRLAGQRPGVRAVILVEPDPERLRQRIRNRGRGFEDLDEATQETVIEGNARFGAHLENAARRERIPVIEVEPLSTTADRLLRSVI